MLNFVTVPLVEFGGIGCPVRDLSGIVQQMNEEVTEIGHDLVQNIALQFNERDLLTSVIRR